MGKRPWQPGDEIPEPPEDHFTDDPLWKLKQPRLNAVVRNRRGLLLFFLGAVLVGVLAVLLLP